MAKYYGVENIRIEHDLNENSIVFEVGGWHGHFSDAIIREFNCNVYIFEPIKSIYEKLVDKYKDNKKIKIFNFGLENFNGAKKIYYHGDGSGIHIEPSSDFEEVEFRNINDVLDTLSIDYIDLIELNCEGSEYFILQEISEKNINKLKKIQVQFHSIKDANYLELQVKVKNKLKLTHKQDWDYSSLFECWSKI